MRRLARALELVLCSCDVAPYGRTNHEHHRDCRAVRWIGKFLPYEESALTGWNRLRPENERG